MKNKNVENPTNVLWMQPALHILRFWYIFSSGFEHFFISQILMKFQLFIQIYRYSKAAKSTEIETPPHFSKKSTNSLSKISIFNKRKSNFLTNCLNYQLFRWKMEGKLGYLAQLFRRLMEKIRKTLFSSTVVF